MDFTVTNSSQTILKVQKYGLKTGLYGSNFGEAKTHIRSAEDLAFAVSRFFQQGRVSNNYYMYHGGTNFGRTAGGSYITTSYDYDAPLDEYGNLNQPKYGHLKQLHAALKVGEKALTSGQVTTKNYAKDVDAIR